MPYARRDPQGQLASLHRQAEPGADEYLQDDHPEVLAFVGRTPDGDAAFARLDADFVRVLEDVIDALVQRNLINITDLPAEAQRKLFSRKGYRERASRHALELFGLGDLATMVPLPDPGAPRQDG
jgi:hypothetical protein